jgi:hypothetical protein
MGKGNAEEDAGGSDGKYPTDDEAEDMACRGAHREPYADFARSLLHALRHDGIDSERHEQQGQQGERAQQPGARPRPPGGLAASKHADSSRPALALSDAS